MDTDSPKVDIRNMDSAEEVRTDAGEEYESAGITPSVQPNGKDFSCFPLFLLSSSTVNQLAFYLRFAGIKQFPDDVGLTDVGSLDGPLRRCLNGWSTQSSLCFSVCN